MSNEIVSSSLTSTLIAESGPLFTAATQSPFLVAAGNGTLSKAKLSEWLSQDRLYAQAYIGFIGSLLALVHLPAQHIALSQHHDSVHWRIALVLQASLENIFRELKFFEDTARQYGLNLERKSSENPFGPVKATTDYVNLFRRFSLPLNHDNPQGLDCILLKGMIVLWATEKCYLEAWRFAASQCKTAKKLASDADGGALRQRFIPNWTNQAFSDFVQQLEQLVDELTIKAKLLLIENARDECTDIWEEVLDIERRFWPEM